MRELLQIGQADVSGPLTQSGPFRCERSTVAVVVR